MEGAHDDPVHASLHTRVSCTSRAPLPHTVSPFTVRTVIEAHAVPYMWVLGRRRCIGRRKFVPAEVNGENQVKISLLTYALNHGGRRGVWEMRARDKEIHI